MILYQYVMEFFNIITLIKAIAKVQNIYLMLIFQSIQTSKCLSRGCQKVIVMPNRHSECNEESRIINRLALSGFFTSFRMTTF